jgi:RNA polymerase sigma factor (sigma-70 family)
MQAPAPERNAELLAAYGRNPSAANRNAVVHANLPLVWRLAREESRRSGHSFDALVQVGCIGLIKAVERFEVQRGSTLSTAACPWIRGAMRQYLRDRCRPLTGSHHLLDLVGRGQRLQHQRLHQGLQPLPPEALAKALGTSLERWREGLNLQRGLRLASLDQPQGDADGVALVELLPAPEADGTGSTGYGAAIRWEQRRQLWRGLKGLERSQRRLVLGRVLLQRSWRELGQQLGLSGKVSQRRCQQALAQLRQRLQDSERPGPPPSRPEVRPAPALGPAASPTRPPAGSEWHSPVHC